MRFVVLLFALALAACSGPVSPPYVTRPADRESRVMRAPTNAPPDPIGTVRPGDRSCTENRDCRAGDLCFAPDYVPAHATSAAPSAAPIAPPAPAAGSTAAAPTPPIPTSASGPIPARPAPGAPSPPAATPPGATPTATPSAPNAPAAPAAAPPGAAPPAAAPLLCQGDNQCTGGQVCASGSCVLACPQAGCPPGQECGPGGHCAPLRCTDSRAPICAQNSRCNTSSGACERQKCTSRSQCDLGACFQGRCYAHDAYCMPQGY